jgi:hypothetical protein
MNAQWPNVFAIIVMMGKSAEMVGDDRLELPTLSV